MAAVALCIAGPLAAQTPAKPDPAVEAAAAMERAKRQAAGPMRVILEASKARRKPGEGESPPSAPATATTTGTATGAAATSDAAGLRSVANRTPAPAAAANPSASPSLPAVAPTAVAPASVPPAVTVAAPGSAAAPAAGSAAGSAGVTTQVTLDAGALGARPSATAVSGLESTSAVGPIVAPLAVAPKLVMPQIQASERVRLLTMVEPEVPQRVLDEMGRNAAILVDLTLRADGSVASVDLASAAPRGLLRMLTPSLEQWKFAPLTAQRIHRVELLFNVER